MPKDKPPRISVNKLAEYIGVKASRQRQILRGSGADPTERKKARILSDPRQPSQPVIGSRSVRS